MSIHQQHYETWRFETYHLIKPLLLEGRTQQQIADHLNDLHSTTYTGQSWHQYSVSRLLKYFKQEEA